MICFVCHFYSSLRHIFIPAKQVKIPDLVQIFMNDTTDVSPVVKLYIRGWITQVTLINKALEAIPESNFQKQIAPGKNRGAYILGHLAAVNDAILPLLGFGDKLYPHLEEPFITSPDTAALQFPPVHELKKYWNEVNDRLQQHFNNLEPEEWLSKHEAVSAEDFAKEPHRNKLNVLISRTNHLSYHLGQLVLLKGTSGD